jgi:hypothetical protein
MVLHIETSDNMLDTLCFVGVEQVPGRLKKKAPDVS